MSLPEWGCSIQIPHKGMGFTVQLWELWLPDSLQLLASSGHLLTEAKIMFFSEWLQPITEQDDSVKSWPFLPKLGLPYKTIFISGLHYYNGMVLA